MASGMVRAEYPRDQVPVPQTAEETLSQLIHVGLWGDTPEERDALFVDYREALQAHT